MKKIFTVISIIAGSVFTTSCTQDPSAYDINSPCVSTSSDIYLDSACERRLPVENIVYSAIIANS